MELSSPYFISPSPHPRTFSTFTLAHCSHEALRSGHCLFYCSLPFSKLDGSSQMRCKQAHSLFSIDHQSRSKSEANDLCSKTVLAAVYPLPDAKHSIYHVFARALIGFLLYHAASLRIVHLPINRVRPPPMPYSIHSLIANHSFSYHRICRSTMRCVSNYLQVCHEKPYKCLTNLCF